MTTGDIIDLTGEPATGWIAVCVVEVSVEMLAEDVCRISLWRGDAADVLHLGHAELRSLDQVLEFPTTAGSDADAARAALSAAARAGHFDVIRVLTGGVLGVDECRVIIEDGDAAYRRAREEARRAALAAEELRPSRILACARDLRLVPEPVGEHSWVANCPGTHHHLMISIRSETFGCGYCKVKGGPEELVAFVTRRRAAAR